MPVSKRGWLLLLLAAGCAIPRAAPRGEEIVVCGEQVPIGTRVILWDEPGGYRASDDHYGVRRPPGETGDALADLQRSVHQIVLHYDAAGTSAQCFKVLQKRGLSSHFMLDLDGTIYQTVDVEARAWHAGKANDASVGIEIANIGAYDDRARLERFDPLPAWIDRGSLAAIPDRGEPVSGAIHGGRMWQYRFTEAQYVALGRLCAALVRTLPRIRRRAPQETTVLSGAPEYEGIIAHYHLKRSKVDPGPAFDWDRLAREMQSDS